MDSLEVWRHLSGVMTLERWQEFRDSEDGMWLRARIEGFKGASMKKLVEAGKKRRAEAWEVASDMARNIINAEVDEMKLDVPEENKAVLIERLAEKLMCEQNIIPPRYTKLVECKTCGPVHAPDDTESVTPNCPWCLI